MDPGSDSRGGLAVRIAQAVENRLGTRDPEVREIITREVELALQEHPEAEAPIVAPHPEGASRVVVTSHGRNRPGILAALTKAIDEFGGDIRDMSQTIVGDYYTVLLVVDISQADPESARFIQLRHRLQEVAADLGVQALVMHDDILSSMHSI